MSNSTEEKQRRVGSRAEETRRPGGSRRRGLRCQVCTGCGLCPGITPAVSAAGKVHVLAEDALAGERIPLPVGKARLAVADIGTTTVAMLLYGQDGSVADRYVAVNPQTSYGADVISRIRAATAKSTETEGVRGKASEQDAAADMQRQIRGILEQGLARFQKKLAEEETLQLVLAANTTMIYLLMGWDTSELGRAPFRATRLTAVQTEIGEVPCFVFPGFSAFVGGDIAADVFACGMGEKEEIALLVDLGTNGEIVLGNREKRIACATAAGPAFEGGVNRGVWGADMISILATLRREGFLDETGLLAEDYFEGGIRIGNVRVTQEAVRAVQLAKGAIAVGIEILLEKYGIIAEQVDRVILAGGFGYYLKPEDAAEIGLLPEKLAEKALAGGNTVLSGALKAGRQLLSGQSAAENQGIDGGERDGCTAALVRELNELIMGTETLNLAELPDFGERYMRMMELKPM